MTPQDYIVYRCKITGGRIIDLPLPPNITKKDADRIHKFILTQVDDDDFEAVTCCRGDDWTRIGAWDGSRTRSIWVRLTFMGPTRLCLSEAGEPIGEITGPCVSIELCAGRSGSDDYVKIQPTDVTDANYSLLVGLFKSQLWALDIS